MYSYFLQMSLETIPDLDEDLSTATSSGAFCFSDFGIIPRKNGYGSSHGMAECSTPSLSRVMMNPLGSVVVRSMLSNTNCLKARSISEKEIFNNSQLDYRQYYVKQC